MVCLTSCLRGIHFNILKMTELLEMREIFVPFSNSFKSRELASRHPDGNSKQKGSSKGNIEFRAVVVV